MVGAGGVGGYYGAALIRVGHEVTLIARGSHLRAIRDAGLRVRLGTNELTVRPAHLTDEPAQVEPVDLLLFCTKAYDTDVAAAKARPLVGPATTVLGLQNGLDAHERIGAVLGMEHMLAGATGIISKVEAPGIIRAQMDSAWITVGEIDGRITPRLQSVADAFEGTGVQVELSDQILSDLWWKLLIVAPLAAFGALTRLGVGEYRQVPDTRPLIMKLKVEIVQLAVADQAAVAAGAVEETMAGMDGLPPDWRSSMQRDVEAGHRSELESIVGVICRRGRALGVGTPVADLLYGLLLPVDLKARSSEFWIS